MHPLTTILGRRIHNWYCHHFTDDPEAQGPGEFPHNPTLIGAKPAVLIDGPLLHQIPHLSPRRRRAVAEHGAGSQKTWETIWAQELLDPVTLARPSPPRR